MLKVLHRIGTALRLGLLVVLACTLGQARAVEYDWAPVPALEKANMPDDLRLRAAGERVVVGSVRKGADGSELCLRSVAADMKGAGAELKFPLPAGAVWEVVGVAYDVPHLLIARADGAGSEVRRYRVGSGKVAPLLKGERGVIGVPFSVKDICVVGGVFSDGYYLMGDHRSTLVRRETPRYLIHPNGERRGVIDGKLIPDDPATPLLRELKVDNVPSLAVPDRQLLGGSNSLLCFWTVPGKAGRSTTWHAARLSRGRWCALPGTKRSRLGTQGRTLRNVVPFAAKGSVDFIIEQAQRSKSGATFRSVDIRTCRQEAGAKDAWHDIAVLGVDQRITRVDGLAMAHAGAGLRMLVVSATCAPPAQQPKGKKPVHRLFVVTHPAPGGRAAGVQVLAERNGGEPFSDLRAAFAAHVPIVMWRDGGAWRARSGAPHPIKSAGPAHKGKPRGKHVMRLAFHFVMSKDSARGESRYAEGKVVDEPIVPRAFGPVSTAQWFGWRFFDAGIRTKFKADTPEALALAASIMSASKLVTPAGESPYGAHTTRHVPGVNDFFRSTNIQFKVESADFLVVSKTLARTGKLSEYTALGKKNYRKDCINVYYVERVADSRGIHGGVALVGRNALLSMYTSQTRMPEILAHELAHMLALPHANRGLMWSFRPPIMKLVGQPVGDGAFTQEQIKIMRANLLEHALKGR